MMQCNDVIRELAAPSDDRDSAALAEHLAGCATCTEWAKRAVQFDHLWDISRPPDPTPQVWDGVWGRILESLESPTAINVDRPAAPATLLKGPMPKVARFAGKWSPSIRRRLWSFTAIASFGLGQAAAVVLVIALAWQLLPLSRNTQIARHPDPLASSTHSSLMDAGMLSIDIDEGNLVVIRSEGQKPEVLILTSESSPFGIDDWLLMFNAVESMAPNPIVAMKE